jgi:hypothetical protein
VVPEVTKEGTSRYEMGLRGASLDRRIIIWGQEVCGSYPPTPTSL